MDRRNDGDRGRSGGPGLGEVEGRLRRLEEWLTAARELEARRARRVEKARRRRAPRKVEARRVRKLEKARRRGAVLEAKIAGLVASSRPAEPAAAEVLAFCMRERRKVAMVDPAPIVMRNGRAGLAGTCPACGARVVRPG